MATKKLIAQVVKSAIDEAASNPLNMKPPTIEDMYEHALGVELGEAPKAQMREERMKADAERNAFFKQLENIEPIPIQIAKAIQAAQSGNGASGVPNMSDLNPEQSKADAREYMARLVCYVWCMIPEHKSKDKACDYVFQIAKDGDRLYADCNRARNLLQTYNYNPNTIKTEAATLHAALVTWRKKTGMEYPLNWRDMVKESKAKEAKSAKQRRGRN